MWPFEWKLFECLIPSSGYVYYVQQGDSAGPFKPVNETEIVTIRSIQMTIIDQYFYVVFRAVDVFLDITLNLFG